MTLAAGTIFLAGLATFASPCVLPMIPIYLSVLMGASLQQAAESPAAARRARLRLVANGGMFVLGFTLVFVALGLTATAVGRFFLAHRLVFQQVGGLLVFVFGLKFLGWLRIEALEREKRFQVAPGETLSPSGALMMGVTFGFGWTPCIGPVLGAVLTYTAVSAEGVLDGAVNLFLYAAGVGAPLLVVALLAQQGVRLLNRIKRFLPRIEKATGAVLVGMAVLMVTDSTSLLTFGVGDDASAGIGQRVVAAAKQADGSDGGAADGSKLLASVGDVGAAVADGGPACGAKATACGVAGADEPVFEPEAGWSTPTGQPTALYFFQPNCPACLEMTPIVRAMTATCAGKGMAVHRIDISQREQRSMAAQYGIRGTPTLVFVDDAGKEVSRLVGASDLGTVHDAIAVLMGQACARFTPM